MEDYDMPGPPSDGSAYSDAPEKADSVRKFCSDVYALRMSKTVRMVFSIAIVVLSFVFTSATENTVPRFMFCGGILSLCGAAFTMGVIKKNRNSGVFQLLFWRAFCDFFVGLRFVLVFDLNRMVCGSRECLISPVSIGNSTTIGTNTTAVIDHTNFEHLCGSQAAFLEFFEIASEMWFFCIALNMYYSLMNPFASTKAMMKRYHILVWTVSLCFALPLGIVENLYGYWYIDEDIDNSAICWMKSHDTFAPDSQYDYIWYMFLLPVLFVYFFAIVVMFVAFYRLQRGMSETLLHKMKALVINTVNVAVFIMFWTFWSIFYGLSLTLSSNAGGGWTARTTVFVFAAKGLTPFFVWILITNVSFSFTRESRFSKMDEDTLDLNGALRKEVLHYATKGIRKCTEKGHLLRETNERLLVRLQNISNSKKLDINACFFWKLMFGFRDEIVRLEKYAKEMSRKQVKSVGGRDTFAFQNFDPDAAEKAGEDDIVIPIQRREWWQKMTMKITGSISNNNDLFRYNVTKANPGTSARFVPKLNKVDARESTGITNEPSESPEESLEDVNAYMSQADKTKIKHLQGQGEKSFCRELADDMARILCGNMTVEFEEFEPYHFRRVRMGAGISDEQYIYFFNTTIKERLTDGGASGAFFFFSRDEIFIAKSCHYNELLVLTDNAKQYADYLESPEGKGSFISKIYGAYKLGIYGMDLYFFVMSNLFYTKEKLAIHQKYDLKGSTYSRSAEPPKHGHSATCLHCEQKFTYKGKKRKAGKRSFKKALKQDFKAVATMAKNVGHGGHAGRDAALTISPMYNEGNGGDEIPGKAKRSVSFFSKPTTANKDAQALEMMEMARKSQLENVDTLFRDGSGKSDLMKSKEVMGVNALNTRTKSDISTTSSSDPSLKCFFTVSGIHEPNVVLKDNDLKYKFKMHAATARDVALQLEADANFLLSIGVMDYSLLVGVHNNEFVIRADPDQPQSTSPLVQRKQGTDPVQISSYASTTGPPLTDMKSKSTDEEPELEGISAARRLEASRIVGADSYLFGIIDFQQKWTLQKKFERFLKIQFKGADPAGLSAIEPHAYKERFTHHMRDVLDVDDYFYES